MKKSLLLSLVFLLGMSLCTACNNEEPTSSAKSSVASSSVASASNAINPNLDLTTEVELVFGSPWESCPGMEAVAVEFMKKYDNCTIKHEYIEDYTDNVPKRLTNKENAIDIILISNIQSTDSPFYEYALDYLEHEDAIDLSETFPGLIDNFTYTDENNVKHLYSVPEGAEVRGMYVNVTMLKKYGLEIPNNITELMAACQTLATNNIIPMQANPSYFAQQLIYPYVANIIANAENYSQMYAAFENPEAGVSDLLEAPMKVVYDIMSNYYYNYKYVETELKRFTDNTDLGKCYDFLNIVKENDEYKKVNDIGEVPFMVGTLSLDTIMQKVQTDYHSEIEYEFILSPVGSSNGGYAYLSPGKGFAINKNSPRLDWAMEFADFFFKKVNNKIYTKAQNQLPNTSDSFNYISTMFDIPSNHISHVGQVTFNYKFYNIVAKVAETISKGNATKYMKPSTEENGDPTLYSFEEYMEQLEDKLLNKDPNYVKE